MKKYNQSRWTIKVTSISGFVNKGQRRRGTQTSFFFKTSKFCCQKCVSEFAWHRTWCFTGLGWSCRNWQIGSITEVGETCWWWNELVPAMQPQQLLVSWDLLEELATAGLQHAVDFNHLWQLEQRWVSPTCWFNRDGSMFSDREPAGECPFDQHEKRATEEEGKEAGRISLLDHIKLPTKSFLLQPDCNKSLYIIGKVLIYWL